jgi:hypothetical protein
MGWEQRGTHRYYYRKQRDGLRVKSVYVGRGEIAHMVSELQSSSRIFEKVIGVAYPSEEEKLKEQDATIEQACGLIDAITKASLLVAGFHSHKRQWRKRRDGRGAGSGLYTSGLSGSRYCSNP